MGFDDMKGQIVGYVRVSTVDQNIERQLEQLQYCDELFIDKVSGKDIERPKLQEMLRHIRKGDIIEVTSIDRLARNNIDLQNLVKEITAKGVVIKFLKDELVKRSAAMGIPVPARGVKPTADKHLRIESLQPHMQNGLLRLHYNTPQKLDQKIVVNKIE